MRYIGCKRRLLPFIHETMIKNAIDGHTLCDLFAGTATVGHYFKQQGYKIISNDLLYTSYIMQQVKVAMNHMPSFSKVAQHLGLNKPDSKSYVQVIVDYLNHLDGIAGFIYQHYTEEGTKNKNVQRLYYTEHNAKKIDVIRESIEAWKQLKIINDQEFYILLYALLQEASRCANTTGTMNSFLKHYAHQSLRQIKLELPVITPSDYQHQVYCEDGIGLVAQLAGVDILYLDPPYTKGQYAASYHVLETIARWDFPAVYGVTGKRDTRALHSALNRKQDALEALRTIIEKASYRHLLMSYSDDSLIPHASLIQLFRQYGEVVINEQPLKRYNSISSKDHRYTLRTHVKERLYYLKPESPSLVHYCTDEVRKLRGSSQIQPVH